MDIPPHAKPTWGQWVVLEASDGFDIVSTLNENKPIAKVFRGEFGEGVFNANFIAAAKLLYEELENCRSIIEEDAIRLNFEVGQEAAFPYMCQVHSIDRVLAIAKGDTPPSPSTELKSLFKTIHNVDL